MMRKNLVLFVLSVFALIACMAPVHAASANRLQKGKQSYDKNCAICHGNYGDGSKTGPPLVHNFYNPGHHSDKAFYRAIKKGVKAHHWGFGDMPPVPTIQQDEAKNIVYFIRILQRSFGITYQPHRM